MADNDLNMIKPVEVLQSVTGLTPVERREERRKKQYQNQQEPEDQLEESIDEQTNDDEATLNNENENTDDIGIDFRA